MAETLYDDGRIVCDDDGLVIRWYYLWGSKRIPYRSIRSVDQRPLTRVRGKWRIWGSGDLQHWYNLDPHRPSKETALELDVGGRVRPTITPDDPEAVGRILAQHGAG
ncbi:MAG TPA: PH domain-containing protein [Acidimicrobiales bacterium]|nr:PH domain-containing protein [Acidimicrobiales bacterium]